MVLASGKEDRGNDDRMTAGRLSLVMPRKRAADPDYENGRRYRDGA
jgi:hypothetical protein